MRIGVDAMGGDFAPLAVVEGVVANKEWRTQGQQVVLFGDRTLLEEAFEKVGAKASDYEIVHCTEVISMNDHPVKAISSKSNSSIVVGFQHLAQKKIDGFASAGNTGAMMAATMTFIKPVEGLIRPAIGAYVPVIEGGYNLLLDVGLNADCKPEVLVQYGILGAEYSQYVMGVTQPRVGLINIGEEPEKGNLISKQTHELMRQCPNFTFAGNIEGNELFTNARANVLVCDGFVGNIILKEAEAFYMIARRRKIQDAFFECFNFENYGGTPVLGVNAPVIIGHGISNGRAIDNMIRQTGRVIASDLCEKFKSTFHNA